MFTKLLHLVIKIFINNHFIHMYMQEKNEITA